MGRAELAPTAWAERLTRYLVGEPPTAREAALFAAALAAPSVPLDVGDERILRVAQRRCAMPYLDAGLALIRPEAELRRRIHLMFAILEASPSRSREFLPGARPTVLAPAVAVFYGTRAVLRAVIGVPLVKVVLRGS